MNYKSIRLNLMLGILILSIGLGIFGYFYKPYYEKKVARLLKRICYENKSVRANPVLVIDDLDDAKEYVSYFNCTKKVTKTCYFNFDLKTIPGNDTVYVLGYSSDSTLAHVISYSGLGKYQKVWVLNEFLHAY